MERERLEGLLIDFIDGRLAEGERQQVRELLNTDPEAMVLYEQLKLVTSAMDRSSALNPSNKLYSRFQAMLKEEVATQSKEQKPQGRQVFFQPAFARAAAAAVLVMMGVGIGYYINEGRVEKARLEAMELEMQKTKAMMLAMMENQLSASQRMQGMNVALTIGHADDDVVNALVKAMNEDGNSNVRLAALDALSKFHEQPHVRKALIESLSKQSDPVVQIALIQLMVKMKEKGIVNELNKIIESDSTIKPVKDEAYSGLLKLS